MPFPSLFWVTKSMKVSRNTCFKISPVFYPITDCMGHEGLMVGLCRPAVILFARAVLCFFAEEKRRVSAAKAEAFCGSKISYFETSAKQATNVSAAFEEIARKAMQHEIKQEQMWVERCATQWPAAVVDCATKASLMLSIHTLGVLRHC